MKLAVLDYSDGKVHMYTLSSSIEYDDEKIEDFLIDKGFNLDEVYYMFGKGITVEYE